MDRNKGEARMNFKTSRLFIMPMNYRRIIRIQQMIIETAKSEFYPMSLHTQGVKGP